MYLSIALFCFLSDNIYIYVYIYVSLLSLFSVYLRTMTVLQATSRRLRRPLWKLLLLVAFHQNKCGIMYWERSKCMKRQEEQEYCDVSKYRSILLSIGLYMFIYICIVSLFLSVFLSKNYAFVFQATYCRFRRPPSKVVAIGRPSSK
jgi:hypothetical protein